MKMWSLPMGRSAFGHNAFGRIGRSASFAALLMSMLCAVLMAPAGAQQGPYFYAGGKKAPLPPRANVVAVQVTPGVSPQNFAKAAGGATKVLVRKRIVLFPAASAARVRSLSGARRTFRTFQNGSLLPIIETDEILVRFKPGVSSSRARELALSVGAALGAPIGATSPNGYLAYVNANTTAIDASNALYQKSEVQWAQPNFIWKKQLRFVPNDPLYPQQWHLKNTGQNGGRLGADIKAEQAWNITQGNPSIRIAVIDSGIDLNHEDLRDKIVAPRDVIEEDNDPSPTGPNEEHGTSVAGLAAASGNNGLGVTGVAFNSRIIPIRLVVDAGWENLDEAQALRHAADSGADIINNSWGPADDGRVHPLPDVTREAIDYATTTGRGGKGCVVLWAAGNGGLINDRVDLDGYASYTRVIAVGSSNNRDIKSRFSETGTTLDIVAPGGEIPDVDGGVVTTDITAAGGYVPENYVAATDRFAGTSAACPIAAGVAALILSRDPTQTYTGVRQILVDSAEKIDPLGGAYDATGFSEKYGFGRVNALRALEQITTFSVSGVVQLPNGTPVPGVTISVEGQENSTTTALDGTYTLGGLTQGFSTIVASSPDYVLTPERQGVFVPPNRTDVNFLARPVPKVTLLSPADNTIIGTPTYPLRATTENDPLVSRVDFERSGTPFTLTRSPGRPIADATTTAPSITTDNFLVSEDGNAASLSVRVSINHPNVRDLEITLISPTGKRIPLYNREGFGTSLNTTFENVPIGPSRISGVWKLEIRDTQPSTPVPDLPGTLVSWGLTFTPWVPIGSDNTRPAPGGEWTATWQVTETPPGTYNVRAVAIAPGPVQEDVNVRIVIPQPSINLLSPPMDSTITGQYLMRAQAENAGSIQRVEFSQRRVAVSFKRDSTTQPNPLPLAIPDLTTVTDTITIPGGGIAESATLFLDVEHQYLGDLKISLIAPNGQVLPVFEEPSNGTTRMRRNFSLPALAGKPFSGQYKLQIEDQSVPDVGRLLAWSLTFNLPWTLISTDSAPSATGIYSKVLDTQTLARGVYDFRAVAVTARGVLEDIHPNVTVNSTTLPSYTISGVVKKGTLPLAGVTITRTGGNLPPVAVTTNASGAYVLPPVVNGDYVVTPSLSGHSFVPFNRDVRIVDGEVVNVNFTALEGASIRGRITDSAGAPLPGITVRRNGTGRPLSQQTDAKGFYSFSGLPAGTYTITPEKEGFGFTPQSRQVRLDTENVLNADFIGVVGYFIKGRITTSGGQPVANVRVARSGSVFTTTNANGEYLLNTVPNGNIYVTPSRQGFNFTPATRLIVVNGAGVTGVDFIAVAGVAVSGRVITTTGAPVSGARLLREGGGTSSTATTNASGVYTFNEVLPGTHVIRPSAPRYAFIPAARGVTVSVTPIDNVNFQAVPDTQGPTVTITRPTAGVYRTLLLATGNASDSGSGVARVTGRLYRAANGSTPAGFWAGGDTWTATYNASVNELVATGTTNWGLNLPSLPTGRYIFRAIATDNAGNRTVSTPVSFTIDMTPPQVQVRAPFSTDYDNLRPTFTLGTATDGESGLHRVTIRLFRNATASTPAGYWAGGTSWTATYNASVNEVRATGTSDWSLNLPYLAESIYTLRATARDRVGLDGYSPEIRFSVGRARLNQTSSRTAALVLSGATASAENDTVTLAVGTPLNPHSIDPARFAVVVNNRAVAVEGVISNGAGGLTLALPEGALAVGATVQVTWTGLQNAQGVTLASGSTVAIAQ